MRNLLIFILLLIAGFSGWYVGSKSTSSSTESISVDSTPVIQTSTKIRGIGKLEPSSGVIKIFAPMGQKIESLHDLDVGNAIEENQPLATLAGRELREMELKIAKAKKIDAENQLEFERSKGKLKKQSAQLAVAEAESIRETISSKSKQLALLSAQLKAAKEQLQRLENLRSNRSTRTMVGQVDIEKQKLLVKQLGSQISLAQDEINHGAERAKRAEKAAEIDLESVAFVIEKSDSSIPSTTLNNAIDAAQKALDMTTIKSPISGQVLDIVVREGDTATNQPIMLIGDTNEIVCVAEINDTYFRKVEPGHTAMIRSTALDKSIEGVVVSKGVMIGPPSMKDPNPFARVDRKTGRVVIKLNDIEDVKGLVNMQVDVEIDTVDVQNAGE